MMNNNGMIGCINATPCFLTGIITKKICTILIISYVMQPQERIVLKPTLSMQISSTELAIIKKVLAVGGER